jgi:hypothetical protein
VLRRSAVVFALLAGLAPVLRAQSPPVIDSVEIHNFDIFAPDELEGNLAASLMNALHVRTHASVIRRELLFHVGDTLDVRRLQETERNLRARGLFRRVQFDTVRADGKLIVRVFTWDGWTTNLDVGFSFTGKTVTWRAGATERNVFGTGHAFGVGFRKEPDRNALRLQTQLNRPLGTRAVVAGYYDDLSDGRAGAWGGGLPFLALQDRIGIQLPGGAASRRILRFRDGVAADTLWRRSFLQSASLGWAPWASPAGYARVGLLGQIRQSRTVRIQDTALTVPDSVTGAVGVFASVALPRFIKVTHYNGFAHEEDIDLGVRGTVQVWAAPAAFGYAEGGVAPLVDVQAGAGTPAAFVRLWAHAHGLFTASGLDSGMVAGSITLASRVIPRQATVLHVEAGAQQDPPPGAEFDLGHGIGPRGFEAHAFTGTRTVWGIAEHRIFLVDALLGLVGLGMAGFVDYGGAWYPDESPRVGGDVGLGLRSGGTASTGPNVGRLDLAYRFGDGWSGGRWVVSFGTAFEF